MWPIILFLLFGFLARQKGNSGHDVNAKPKADESKAFPNGPIAVVCIPPAPTDEERAEKKRENRRKVIKFYGEIAGLIVLALYTTFTYLLLKSSNKTLKQSSEQFRLDERAWVGVNETDFKFAVGQPGQFLIVIVNSGKTPAIHTHVLMEGRSVIAGQSITFQHSAVQHGFYSDTVIQPGAKVTTVTTTDTPLTQEQFNAAKSGKVITYVFGTIIYNDIFPSSPVHHTTFCAVLMPGLERSNDCAGHNEAD
jgi:hypothetical protein